MNVVGGGTKVGGSSASVTFECETPSAVSLTIPVLMSCHGVPINERSDGHLQGHLRKKFDADVILGVADIVL